jgi:hypothetical protein
MGICSNDNNITDDVSSKGTVIFILNLESFLHICTNLKSIEQSKLCLSLAATHKLKLPHHTQFSSFRSSGLLKVNGEPSLFVSLISRHVST